MLLIGMAALVALFLRDNFDVNLQRLQPLVPYIMDCLIVAFPMLLISGLPRRIWGFSSIIDYYKICAVVSVTVLGGTIVTFERTKFEDLARSLPVLHALVAIFMMVGLRVAVRQWRSARVRGVDHTGSGEPGTAPTTVLLIGLNRLTELYIQLAATMLPRAVRIGAIVADNRNHAGLSFDRHEVIDAASDLGSAIDDLRIHGIAIDRIVVLVRRAELADSLAARVLELSAMRGLPIEFFADQILTCGDTGAGAALPAASTTKSYEADAAGPIAPRELGPTEHTLLMNRPYWSMKRLLDVTLAAVLLLVLSPIIAIVAAAISVDMGRPTVFWQQRPGRNGRPFKLYKFRSMRPAFDAAGVRIADEQRVSNFGRFLRATRLDEIPQLWNILIGEMSFVGPRPLLPIDQPVQCAARLLVRPGLTGWAQIKGGRHVDVHDKAALDFWYLHHASLYLDLAIMIGTLPMVLRGERVDHVAIERAWTDLRTRNLHSDADRAGPPAAAVDHTRQQPDSGTLAA